MTIRAVHHLNCGTMCPMAGQLFGQKSWRATLVAHCLLLETERDGLVLVDTGFGTRDCAGETGIPASVRFMLAAKFDTGETALAQVEALGHRAEDVRHIVVTHLDVDHAGGISDFPHAKVHLHAREHAAAMAPPTFAEKQRYIRAQLAGAHYEVYSEDGDTWRGLPAITKLRGLDADIGLLPLHGHTRGHSAVIVNADRWVVHAGDAYFHRHTLAGAKVPVGFRMFESAMCVNNPQRRASAAALRQLHQSYPDVAIFSAHDPEELAASRSVSEAA